MFRVIALVLTNQCVLTLFALLYNSALIGQNKSKKYNSTDRPANIMLGNREKLGRGKGICV